MYSLSFFHNNCVRLYSVGQCERNLIISDDDLLDQNFTTCKPLLDVGLFEVDNPWPQSTLMYVALHFRGSHMSCNVHWMTLYTKSECEISISGSCQVASQCLHFNTKHSTLPDSTLVTTCQFSCSCWTSPCRYIFLNIKESSMFTEASPQETYLCEVVPKPGNMLLVIPLFH